jgi:Tfp pilus assembly protein PilN
VSWNVEWTTVLRRAKRGEAEQYTMQTVDGMGSGGVNFLPDDYVEQRAQSRWNVVCIGLLVIVFLGIVAGVWVQQRALGNEARQRDQVDAQYAAEGTQIAQINDMEKQRNDLLDRFEVSQSLLEPIPRSKLLAALTHDLPPSTDLLEIELHTHEIAAPPPPVKEGETATQAPPAPPKRVVEVSVSGQAASDTQVALFMANLGNDPLLRDVNLVFSDEYKQKDETLRRFKVEMKLANESPVLAAAGPVSGR